jgi:hypothetical protein
MLSNGKLVTEIPEQESARSETRLASSKNILNILPRVEVRPMNGRVIGTKSKHIPPMVKRIIGEAAHMAGKGNGETTAVAEAFDVHPNTVTRAKKETGEAREHLDKEIHEKALDAIVGMFETTIIPEKLAKLEPKDATRAMKDLAKVAETFGPKKGINFNGPTIVMFAPNQHEEADYNIVEINPQDVKRG